MGKKLGSSYKKCHLCPFGTNNSHIFKRHRLRCVRTHKQSNTNLLGASTLDSTADSEWETMDTTVIESNTKAVEKDTKADEKDNDKLPALDIEEDASVSDSANSNSQDPFDANANSMLPSPKISRNYKCTDCSFTTTKPKIFLSHQIEVHQADYTIYPCSQCEYASRYKHKMQRHEQFAHNGGKSDTKVVPSKLPAIPKLKVKLSNYGKKFSKVKVKTAKKAAVTASKKTATLKKAAECVIPIVPPDGVNTHRCKFCVYKSKSRPRVLNHVISMHINAKVLKCKMCSYTTTRKIELYLHKNEHMSGKPIYNCTECSYTSYFKPNLDRHMENHGRDYAFKCDYCNFSTETSGALARHISNNHAEGFDTVMGDGEEVTDQSLEDGLYPCDCGSAHKTAEDLQRHIAIKHPEKNRKKKTNMGAVFDNEDIPAETSSKNPESMDCKYCNYVAKWPSDYKRHLKVHSLEKRYKCPICFKKYKYTGDLNVHIRRDHNMEPEALDIKKVSIVPLKKNSPAFYRCPACPYKTNWKSEMERHSHIHGAEDKTYQCNYCTYQTYWRGDVTRHLYRKHDDKISKDDDILHHVIFRNDLVVPKGKARYGTVEVKKEVLETEFESYYEPEPEPEPEQEDEQDMEWDSQSGTSPNYKEVTLTGATNNNGIFHCDHCEFTANAPSKMKAHVATHLNFKQFMCPVCGKRANWKWDIQKHMKKDHPLNTVPVVKLSEDEARDTIGNYLATMPAVRRSHHLPSPTKPAKSPPKVTLNIPVIRRLSQKEPPIPPAVPESSPEPVASSKSSIDSGKKPYQCSLCGLRSNFRWSIRKHLKTIHEGVTGGSVIIFKTDKLSPVKPERKSDVFEEKPIVAKPSPPKAANNDDSRKLYMCVVCEKKCILKGDIKKHYKYIHPGMAVEIKYLVTGEVFLYDKSLPDHGQRITEKSEPNSSFEMSMNSTLDSTMENSPTSADKSIEDVKPVDPPDNFAAVMGHQTSTHNDPKKHGYVKPFKCSLCGHRSNWKWDSKRHLRDKHRGQAGYIIVLSIEDATSTYTEECMVHSSPEKKPQPTPQQQPIGSLIGNDGGRLKRLKCSECDYRSNWRTDIVRHGRNRHPNCNPRIIVLDIQEAKKSLETYNYTYQRSHTYQTAEGAEPSPPIRKTKNPMPVTSQKIWKCPKCAFCGVGTSEIIKHMQKHNMKPFKCLVCEFTTNFRGALYRHVRKIHSECDYTTCTKVMISYSNEDQLTNTGTAEEPFREAYVDIYLCKVCNFQTSFKHLCCKHLKEKHNNTDYSNVLKIRKRQKIKVKNVQKGETAVTQKDKGKRYMCSICPYKAFKHGLLNFHMTYHEPQPGNKYKCKFCPYFVCTPRLLQQHMKLHTKEQGFYKIESANSSPMKKDLPSTSEDDSQPRRHICEKCPYTTNSKNDFIYHKQFHRPKPSAEFKCEFCDYWVTHKRLLKQHMKLHTDAMNLNMQESVQNSPSKSEESNIIFDTVEIAAIKQKIISSKITASLSASPSVSPMKIASKCGVGSRPGYILKSGVYRKLHRCKKCPYYNVRTRNLQLHEMMHGYRPSPHPLLKCMHCDYYVGARGLLSHHLKVHQADYNPELRDPAISNLDDMYDDDDRSSDTPEIQMEHKVDTLLEIARFKKFCCEKCPYATAKRFQFQRHCELHGSKQRHTCDFCDYSVPSNNLLLQHRKIHMMPNQNLLAAQSLTNLQHLTEVPADVALASALPPVDMREPITISVIHDHLDLYENMEPLEPKKLYRCDRCPYANVRRDHLLTHLKFHVIKSELTCPYCDYSVSKQHFLAQHVKVHFCPLPELSDWLMQNGQTKRAKEIKDRDISEAVELAQVYQNELKMATHLANTELKRVGEAAGTGAVESKAEESVIENGEQKSTDEKAIMGPPPPPKPKGTTTLTTSANTYICQYCDREFTTSEHLLRHEMQHLIGNHFENDLCSVSSGTKGDNPDSNLQQTDDEVMIDLETDMDAESEMV